MYDKDTMSDDEMGEVAIDLHRRELGEDYESEEAEQRRLEGSFIHSFLPTSGEMWDLLVSKKRLLRKTTRRTRGHYPGTEHAVCVDIFHTAALPTTSMR